MLRDVFGLQAQLLSAAWLGIRGRGQGLKVEDLDRAVAEERSIVRSWLFRGTLHLVAADDLRWLLRLLGPLYAGGTTSREAELGLTEDVKVRGVRATRRILASAGPLTREELVDHLSRHGIALDRRSQAPIHLIRLAALQGVLCLGPQRADGKQTYVLLDDWLPESEHVSRRTALAEMALRYFKAFGPATVDDLAAFSGLRASEAREATLLSRSELVEVTIEGETAFMARRAVGSLDARRPAAVRLLPAFDTYLLGYRRRDLAVPRALQARLQRGGGWLHPVVVVNGEAVGAWSLLRAGRLGTVRVESVGPLPRGLLRDIQAEVADIGRFLDITTRLEVSRGLQSAARPGRAG